MITDRDMIDDHHDFLNPYLGVKTQLCDTPSYVIYRTSNWYSSVINQSDLNHLRRTSDDYLFLSLMHFAYVESAIYVYKNPRLGVLWGMSFLSTNLRDTIIHFTHPTFVTQRTL